MNSELLKQVDMAPRVTLGNYITRVERVNASEEYGIDDVRGVSNTKGFMKTRANIEGRSLKNFLVVQPQEFVFNRRTTRNGERLGLGFNMTERAFILTEDYVAFRVKSEKETELLACYLYLYFLRDEFDRYVRSNSWGSATEFFNWDDMCRVKIPLPPIEVQMAYVEAYKGLTALIEENEALLKSLEATAQACVAECRLKWPLVVLSDLITEINERNSNGKFMAPDVRGVNTDKQIQKAKRQSENLLTYKVVYKNNLVFNPNIKISKAGEKFAIGINKDHSCIVSNFYVVIQVCDRLMPEFLYLWLIREDFARYIRFVSCSTVRESFGFDDMCRVKIPLPPIEVQKAIVALYHCAEEARSIADEARAQLAQACPAMIQQAAHRR